MRVMFNSDDPSSAGYKSVKMKYIVFFICVISSIFGSIHCANWFFIFPTTAERWLWRICSSIVAIYPSLILIGTHLIGRYFSTKILPSYLGAITLIYLTRRTVLVIEAFATLRSLPPDAFAVVEWTSLLPHI